MRLIIALVLAMIAILFAVVGGAMVSFALFLGLLAGNVKGDNTHSRGTRRHLRVENGRESG